MKIAFYTLGCKVNQYETNWLSEAAEENGFTVVSHNEEADVYVVNSCTVTGESDRKTRQTVRRFKRAHPESIVVLTGCMPQAFPEDAEKLTEADIVLGNKNNHQLFDLIKEYYETCNRVIKVEQHKTGDGFVPCKINNFEGRTRAIVKIEDGCDRFCSYCIIPYSRGRVRSKGLDDLKEEFEALFQKGFCEVVLVGINLSSYGKDTGNSMCDVVELADKIGFKRIRLGSLEPDHITDEVINRLSKVKSFCPQFHLSLQSGCNKTLKTMNRHYTAEEYYELCEKLRKAFRNTSLTTDIMVGFPDESEEDFEESARFAEKVGFEKVHVFPYSPREGTRAAKMKQLEKSVKENRSREMIKRTNKIRNNYLLSQVGKEVNVLFETRTQDGFTEGYTENYTPVKVKGEIPCNEIKKIKITAVDGDFCVGETV
ncbi:MAG: tRNA (N(6)-L-threonylcarbamoyladenosine(37)-C(2))-methylthiotransferase MtaB [Clostridia bacterium]|nr:tRNA (N(6)-L-threonylcarbamoyladenosine(37)-C(2))-methylthiotransferase MtaB [Clostridia bacterium]